MKSTYSVKPELLNSSFRKGQKMSKMVKKADVKKLIAFFEVPQDAKNFYRCVLDSVERVMQDQVDELDENEPFFLT